MLTVSDLIIGSSETLQSALQRMTSNRLGVLFVCDEDSHLVGVLSDGDVRRSILNEILLLSPVEKVMNTDPVTARDSSEAAHRMRRMNIVAVPVVDSGSIIREVVIEDHEGVQVLSSSTEEKMVSAAAGALAIIPARGGSKRIPRKNLAMVAGRTLLAWSIRAAKATPAVAHVLVSTDDPEIAREARAEGAIVPWLRPEALSTDTTPTIDVIVHALEWAAEKLDPRPEIVVLLEPTAPLRTSDHIDNAIQMLLHSDADSVVSICELPHVFHPEEVLAIEGGALKPYLAGRTLASRRLRGRQSSAYIPSGLVYAFHARSVLAGQGLFGKRTLPLVARWEDFLDIDTSEDLELAAFKMERLRARV